MLSVGGIEAFSQHTKVEKGEESKVNKGTDLLRNTSTTALFVLACIGLTGYLPSIILGGAAVVYGAMLGIKVIQTLSFRTKPGFYAIGSIGFGICAVTGFMSAAALSWVIVAFGIAAVYDHYCSTKTSPNEAEKDEMIVFVLIDLLSKLPQAEQRAWIEKNISEAEREKVIDFFEELRQETALTD